MVPQEVIILSGKTVTSQVDLNKEQPKKINAFPSWLRDWAYRFFVDGLTGMAFGLFATLIVGTILVQIGSLIGTETLVGKYLIIMGKVASALTGAGIGVGVALKLKVHIYVLVSAATAGMVGAFAGQILAGKVVAAPVITLTGPGEPLGAFLAAYVAIELGGLVSGKTPVDVLVTPITSIVTGSTVGLILGPPISAFMVALGDLVNWGTEQAPFLMGIIVAVIMGMILTLPISSAALGIILDLGGLAAGAATIGCTTQMVGFAVMSYRENRVSGLIAQGLGTSMLQMPNIVRHPLIWVPPTLASAILGPIGTVWLGMTNNATGSGMGSSGLVGQIMTIQTMTAAGESALSVWVKMIGIQFVAPIIVTLIISEIMRRYGLIKPEHLKLEQL